MVMTTARFSLSGRISKGLAAGTLAKSVQDAARGGFLQKLAGKADALSLAQESRRTP
jgi:hypothetical protein